VGSTGAPWDDDARLEALMQPAAEAQRKRVTTVVRTAELADGAAPPHTPDDWLADPLTPQDPWSPSLVAPKAVEQGRGAVLRRIGRRHAEQIPLEPDERRAVIASLFFEGSRRPAFVRRYSTLMAMSVSIAAFGLIADSTAVVIGAMLVAPLMAPALAASAAIVMGWPQRIRRNLGLVALGALGAVGLAAGIGVFAREALDPLPAEVVARTRANLLDLFIAAAAGAAGAYAYVRRQASDALAGAAVAVALIPPLSVVGLMLTLGEYRLASGALILFIVNVAGVVASGAATFLVAGLAPGQRLLSSGSKIQDGLRWAAVATIIVALPLQFGQTRLLAAPLDQDDVEAAVEDWAESTQRSVETVDVGVQYEDGHPEVDVVIATPDAEPPVEELAEAIAERADEAVTVEIQVVETDKSVVNVESGGEDDVRDAVVEVVDEED